MCRFISSPVTLLIHWAAPCGSGKSFWIPQPSLYAVHISATNGGGWRQSHGVVSDRRWRRRRRRWWWCVGCVVVVVVVDVVAVVVWPPMSVVTTSLNSKRGKEERPRGGELVVTLTGRGGTTGNHHHAEAGAMRDNLGVADRGHQKLGAGFDRESGLVDLKLNKKPEAYMLSTGATLENVWRGGGISTRACNYSTAS